MSAPGHYVTMATCHHIPAELSDGGAEGDGLRTLDTLVTGASQLPAPARDGSTGASHEDRGWPGDQSQASIQVTWPVSTNYRPLYELWRLLLLSPGPGPVSHIDQLHCACVKEHQGYVSSIQKIVNQFSEKYKNVCLLIPSLCSLYLILVTLHQWHGHRPGCSKVEDNIDFLFIV